RFCALRSAAPSGREVGFYTSGPVNLKGSVRRRGARDGAEMKRLLRRALITAGFASAGVLAIAGTALANTVTIGSDLTATSDGDLCLTPCIAVQQSQTGGSSPNPLTSPANGIVTQWAIRSTDNVTYGFRILRPAGANTYTSVVTALGEDPGNASGAVLTYPVSLPISQGDA